MIILKFTDIRLLFNFSFDFRAAPVAQKVSSLSVLWKPMIAQHSARLFNLNFQFPKIFCKGKESDLKSCLRNVKCALQAVQWSRRSRLSRGFDFSAPRRLFRVLRELDRRTFDDSAETPDRGKISLWKNLFIKEFVGLHWLESTNHYKKSVFFFFKICLLALFSFDSSVDSELILFLSTHLKTQGDR